LADYINEITILVVGCGRESINKIIEQNEEVKVIDNLELFRRIYNPSDYILQCPKEFIKTDVDYDTTDYLRNKNINYGKTLVRKPYKNYRRKN
jgi:hypothetical protein